jgi:hypothetical protein
MMQQLVNWPISFEFRIPSYFFLTMADQNFKLQFPLWKFLTQPVFDAQSPITLNPAQFWHRYRFEHLERCWIRTYRPEERFRN